MKSRALLPLLVGVITLSSFQNCAQNGFATASDEVLSFTESSSQSDTGHPGEPVPKFDSFQEPIINKLYIAEVMRSIFKSGDGGVESLLDRWVMSNGPNFGIGCDIYSSSSNAYCYGGTANANTATRTNATVMRELYRLKICNTIIGAGGSVASAMPKVGLTPGSSVTPENLAKVYSLFYRTQDPSPFEIETFTQLATSLETEGVNRTEQWRAILITICETTGWQQF